MSNTNNTLEILVNLIYLARHSTDDPEKVIEYLTQAEHQALQLAEKLSETQNLATGCSGEASDYDLSTLHSFKESLARWQGNRQMRFRSPRRLPCTSRHLLLSKFRA